MSNFVDNQNKASYFKLDKLVVFLVQGQQFGKKDD